MTQEQKIKLDQTCKEKYPGSRYDNALRRVHFKAGAQTILDNPGEWGLEATKEALTGRNRVTSLQLQNAKLKTENDRYRKALERVSTPIYGEDVNRIAKEALKQEVNND